MKEKWIIILISITTIFAILVSIYLFSNFSQVITISQLIQGYDNITVTNSSVASSNTSKAQKVEQVKNKITDIKFKKLSRDEDAQFFMEEKRLIGEDFLSVDFRKGNQVVGKMLIWPDGSIVVADISTMLSTNRTITYKTLNKHPELYLFFKSF